jgi:hypothetical protein
MKSLTQFLSPSMLGIFNEAYLIFLKHSPGESVVSTAVGQGQGNSDM